MEPIESEPIRSEQTCKSHQYQNLCVIISERACEPIENEPIGLEPIRNVPMRSEPIGSDKT